MAERLSEELKKSNISAVTINGFLEEYDDADETVNQAVAARKDLRKRIKGAGINLAAFDRARKSLDKSGEKREEEDHHYRLIMAAAGKPVGPQIDLGLENETQTPEQRAAESVARGKRIDNEGFDAGHKGRRADLNPWTPGTEEFARWHNAWTRGQAQKVEDQHRETAPAPAGGTEVRRRGRPRKDAQSVH